MKNTGKHKVSDEIRVSNEIWNADSLGVEKDKILFDNTDPFWPAKDNGKKAKAWQEIARGFEVEVSIPF